MRNHFRSCLEQQSFLLSWERGRTLHNRREQLMPKAVVGTIFAADIGCLILNTAAYLLSLVDSAST